MSPPAGSAEVWRTSALQGLSAGALVQLTSRQRRAAARLATGARAVRVGAVRATLADLHLVTDPLVHLVRPVDQNQIRPHAGGLRDRLATHGPEPRADPRAERA